MSLELLEQRICEELASNDRQPFRETVTILNRACRVDISQETAAPTEIDVFRYYRLSIENVADADARNNSWDEYHRNMGDLLYGLTQIEERGGLLVSRSIRNVCEFVENNIKSSITPENAQITEDTYQELHEICVPTYVGTYSKLYLPVVNINGTMCGIQIEHSVGGGFQVDVYKCDTSSQSLRLRGVLFTDILYKLKYVHIIGGVLVCKTPRVLEIRRLFNRVLSDGQAHG